MGCGMSRLDHAARLDDNHCPIAKHKPPVSSSPINNKLDINPSVISNGIGVVNNQRSVSSPCTGAKKLNNNNNNNNVDREREVFLGEEDRDGGISNLEDVNNAGSLWMGSPSFREYCVDRKDSVDVDNLQDSHINPGKKDISEERENNMQREDKIMTASNEGSKTVAAPKKRSGKKLKNVFHFPGRPMVES